MEKRERTFEPGNRASDKSFVMASLPPVRWGCLGFHGTHGRSVAPSPRKPTQGEPRQSIIPVAARDRPYRRPASERLARNGQSYPRGRPNTTKESTAQTRTKNMRAGLPRLRRTANSD
jgi:hypothetical protein